MALPDKLHSQGTHALFIFLEVGHSLNSNSSASTGIQGGLTEDACRGWAVRKGVQFPSGIVFCSLPCRAATKTIACVLFTHAPILGARPEAAHWGAGGGSCTPPCQSFKENSLEEALINCSPCQSARWADWTNRGRARSVLAWVGVSCLA